ncbi:hypothetical protein U1Q18_015732 [Sarracenia purpurea var. burkii]
MANAFARHLNKCRTRSTATGLALHPISTRLNALTRFTSKSDASQIYSATKDSERIERHLGRRVLRLLQRVAEAMALVVLTVEVHSRLERRCVIRTFPYARVRWQVKAALLRQLLQLILVHLSFTLAANPDY